MWLSSELDLESIKTNILSKIHDYRLKNVISRVLTRFSFDMTLWPSFSPQATQFELNLETIKTNRLSKIHYDYLKTWPYCANNVFPLIWLGGLDFWPNWMTQFQSQSKNY